MRRRFRARCMLKLAALLAVGGSLFQTASCTSDLSTLGQDLVTSVVDIWITDYFTHQLNAPTSLF